MACSFSDSVMGRLAARCAAAGVRFVGDVRGGAKAELFAGAKALLLPTEFEEGCPVVIAEALMSGTPVIASPRGGCAEMVTPGVGFLCETADDYLRAAGALASVRPEDCRRRATEGFHYLDMARRYVEEYREEVEFYASNRDAYVEQTLLRFTARARREPREARR
jgi:glycosyltransferase involved in cell wall biosynthesis